MLLKEIEEQFPYVSVVAYGGNEYVGIIANQDQYVTTMFVYTGLKTNSDKRLLLDIAETWWWESNRLIPVSTFMRREIDPVRYCMMSMNSKDVKVVVGPCVNLNNLSLKRVKEKVFSLLKN